MAKFCYVYITLVALSVIPLQLWAKAAEKPVHKLSPSTTEATPATPTRKVNTAAHFAVYSAEKADGSGFFSDRQPLNMRYKILRYDCFACDPSSNINWFTTPLFIRPYNQLINAAAIEHKLDPALIRAVIHAESAFRPSVISKKGAMGLMQLMPKTAESLGVTDASLPGQNIPAGSQYLAGLLQQYEGNVDLALAAYNAGSTNVRRYKGIPPFAETQAYVKRVSILHKRYQSAI
ncbi:lytic transglycosylase domain-containing protein [Rheinheimera salexigens]|uniref:Lytic transglycosylase n=1 Tax=Rheinheimera salexigens TaxID=1628148 RepID=A0A1E7Q5I8_9GAMM|nr:lytic transglycosylase domain-containing protein [Rheinheimera salexigens]OEY69343.1 lytic transglycosylase [Rheinheimera salexigens]